MGASRQYAGTAQQVPCFADNPHAPGIVLCNTIAACCARGCTLRDKGPTPAAPTLPISTFRIMASAIAGGGMGGAAGPGGAGQATLHAQGRRAQAPAAAAQDRRPGLVKGR